MQFSIFFVLGLIIVSFSNAETHSMRTESLKPSSAQDLACKEAAQKLEAQLQLVEQVGAAFIQTNDTLMNVYGQFGRQINNNPSSDELAEISKHFFENANALKQAQIQNQEMIDQLNQKTQLLFERVKNCL